MTDQQPKRRRGRPPKNPRTDSDTKKLLIRSGVELLTQQGFLASGLDKILQQVGIPKGSFYHYFSSKEAFGLEVLANYDQYFAAKLDKHLQNTEYTPLARLANFVADAKQSMARFDFQRGCLVGNLEQEIHGLPASFQPRLLQAYRHWQQKVADCFLAAQQAGELNQSENCEQLAEVFWIGWEGAVSRAKLVKSVQPLDAFFNHFMLSIHSTLVVQGQ